jgi:hypothetical protein
MESISGGWEVFQEDRKHFRRMRSIQEERHEKRIWEEAQREGDGCRVKEVKQI